MSLFKFSLLAVFVLSCSGTSNTTPVDDGKKQAVVKKVISLLENLQAKVELTSEEETKTYNKFVTFCTDMRAEKDDAIKTDGMNKLELSTRIEQAQSARTELGARIVELTDDIEQIQGDIRKAADARSRALDIYKANSLDLASMMEALIAAIDALKSSKTPALLQVQKNLNTVRKAFLLAETLGVKPSNASKETLNLLQDEPDIPMENYQFHSNDIISTLEELKKKTSEKEEEVTAAEVKAAQEHSLLVQELRNQVKTKKTELADSQQSKSAEERDILTLGQQLQTVSAQLADNEKYLEEINEICTAKAKTWEQRSGVRRDELAAIAAAIGVLKSGVMEHTTAATIRLVQNGIGGATRAVAIMHNPRAMSVIEAETEDMATRASRRPSFLQLTPPILAGSSSGQGKNVMAALSVLRSRAAVLKSGTLTKLTDEVAKDPFVKVKYLIQNLIERLLEEAANDGTHKGWCDKSLAENNRKRDRAAQDIESLNARLAESQASGTRLAMELSLLDEEITSLKQSELAASNLRSEESVENEATVAEAKKGLEAVKQAVEIISKFQSAAAKAEVSFMQMQDGPQPRQPPPTQLPQNSPSEDMPDAGFKIGEAYKGSQGEMSGILGLFDVINSDFVRTIEETMKAESEALKEHQRFLTETATSLAKKTEIKSQRESENAEATANSAQLKEDLDQVTTVLGSALKQLNVLKPSCVGPAMSVEERFQLRQEEIAALKQALCILDNGSDAEC